MNFVDLMCAAQAKKKIEEAKGDVNEIAKIGAGMLLINDLAGGTMSKSLKKSKKARDKELRRQARQEASDREELIALRNSPEYDKLPRWRKFILNVALFF